jgi:hypothetical protein
MHRVRCHVSCTAIFSAEEQTSYLQSTIASKPWLTGLSGGRYACTAITSAKDTEGLAAVWRSWRSLSVRHSREESTAISSVGEECIGNHDPRRTAMISAATSLSMLVHTCPPCTAFFRDGLRHKPQTTGQSLVAHPDNQRRQHYGFIRSCPLVAEVRFGAVLLHMTLQLLDR